MAFLDKFATGLQGLGAGLGGNGAQFMQALDQRRQQEAANQQAQAAQQAEISKDRQKAMSMDGFTVRKFLNEDNPEAALKVLDSRLAMLGQLGGDTRHTAGLRSDVANGMASGDMSVAIEKVNQFATMAIGRGYADPFSGPTAVKASDVTDQGQTFRLDDKGNVVASNVSGFKGKSPTPGSAKNTALREREIALKESEAQRRSVKLSAGLESALLSSQEKVVSAQRNAREYDVLANDFANRVADLQGGAAGSFGEFLKGVLGTQDDVSEFRRRFNQVRLSEGLKNLPPGPATDRDVQEAFKGVPKPNASPEQIQSFLRGAARLARFDAGFNQFKADFISERSSAKGLNKEWRKQIQSPILKRKVSVAEIYETAQNRGITPEDVKQQLGIN